MPGSRRFGLHRKAGQHGAASLADACLAAPLSLMPESSTLIEPRPALETLPEVEIAGSAWQDVAQEKVSILLVDDQPSKLLAHKSVLLELDQHIVTAGSGREALECLLKYDFAVILLDVNMPDIDGFEIARMIRQRPRFEHTPILFI